MAVFVTIVVTVTMTLYLGIKGGGFDQELTKVKISNDIVYEKPARWLGFRNICEYQYWKNEG